MTKSITVKNKSELEEALSNEIDEIIVIGELAKELYIERNRTTAMVGQGNNVFSSKFHNIINTITTFGLSPEIFLFIIGITALTSVSIIAIYRNYDVEFSFGKDGIKVALRKRC